MSTCINRFSRLNKMVYIPGLLSPYLHTPRFTRPPGPCPMNKCYDNDGNVMHKKLKYDLIHHPELDTTTQGLPSFLRNNNRPILTPTHDAPIPPLSIKFQVIPPFMFNYNT
jgi:hypothetical protein